MKTSICLFLTDLVDEGVDTVLDNVQERAGLDALSIACNYHHARDVFPHNPRAKVRYMDAEVFVRVRPDRYGLLQPPASPLLGDRDVFADVVERARARGLAIRGWANVTHNSRLGAAHPECTVENLFGDRYRSNLCPANPHVRAYASALFEDIARYRPDAVFAESVGYLPFEHGDHHERCHVALSPVARYVLGFCFCGYCRALAGEEGVEVDAVRDQLRAELERVLDGQRSILDEVGLSTDGLAELCDGQLDGFLRARSRAVTTLVTDIVEATSTSDVPFSFMDLSGGLKAAGSGVQVATMTEPAITRSWQDGVDFAAILSVAAGLSGIAYVRDTDEFRSEVEAFRSQVPAGKSLAIAVRPMLPDCEDPANLQQKVAIARANGVDWVDFYHYGFMPLHRLDWIRQARDRVPVEAR